MTAFKVPTMEDYERFDGAHCHRIWERLSDEWRCPGCDRTKFQIMRWTKRLVRGQERRDWLAAFHRHHDHGSDSFDFGSDGMYLPGEPERFAQTILCDHCNAADASAKRKLGLPSEWSFAPREIREFVTAAPHRGHVIDFVKARTIYERVIFGGGDLPR